MGMAQPIGAQAEEADDLAFDVGLDHVVTDIGVFAEGVTVALRGDAVFQELIHDAVAPDHTTTTVLQLQVGGDDAPAVILATVQVKSWDAYVVEENRVLEPWRGAPFPTGREQFHGAHVDAR